MKKLLSSVLICALFCVVSCGPKDSNGKKGDKITYLLSKVKDVNAGKALDFQEIKYSSTNPVVVSEFYVFNWANDSEGAILDSKFVFKDIVRTSNQITLNAELLKNNGDVEPYGAYVITLNNDGFAQKANFISKSFYMKDTEFQMEYNSNGYINKIATTGDENFVIDFTYDGANISKFSYSDEEGDSYQVALSGYTTENKGGIMHPSIFDYDGMLDVFTNLNILGNCPKMLPSKASSSDGAETYIYEKDANGCISKITITSGISEDDDVYLYEYIEVVEKNK